jgi:hypothetical protein
MKAKNIIIPIFLFICFESNGQSQEDLVLKQVNNFFTALDHKDSTLFESIFLPDAYMYNVRRSENATTTRASKSEARFNNDQWKERLREDQIEIRVEGDIGMVWAPYDFWVNGEHSHCGYEVFTLLKSGNEWKIASLTYSIEQEGCE